MDASEVGPQEPGKASVPRSRWTPVTVWLLTVTAVPVVLVALFWTEQVVGLPFVDHEEPRLDRLVPPVAGLAFVICLISIWRSSSTVPVKILVTLATVPVLLVGIMMALLVLFWRLATMRT